MEYCRFCEIVESVEEKDWFGSVVAVRDRFPVTPLHWLVLPIEHRVDYFELTEQEKLDTDRALMTLRSKVVASDPSVEGFNIGWNCGVVAGQTILHAHAHLIPRRPGDVDDPRGGIRGVVPDRQRY